MKDEKTYSEKLKDPRWQKKRLEILDRDNFTCLVCHSKTATLHVHHMLYNSKLNPWEYDNDDLKTLCEECHEIYHNIFNNEHGTDIVMLVVKLYYDWDDKRVRDILKTHTPALNSNGL